MTQGAEIECAANGLTLASDNFDASIYSALAQSANLIDLRCTQSKFFVTKKYIGQLFEKIGPFERYFDYDIENPSLIEEQGYLFGIVRWNAGLKDGRKNVAKFSCEYYVTYANVNGFPPEYCYLYFQKLARFSSFPYFRAYVGAQAAAAGIIIPPLPALRERVD